jgi:glycosyltransferase involved in cell wall biosynthesis
MPKLQALKTRLGIRIVGCCHDLIPIKYPQYCVRYVADRFPEYLSQLARSCDAIACVSECSLTDLREALSQMGEPVPHLFTIRLGADLPPAGAAPVSPVVSSVTGQPYVLFVSTMERRKNHEVLYRAFHRLARVHGRERLPKLVFVGSRGWGVGDLLNDIELDPMTRGLIVQLHNVSDSDLRILYRNALFCVFPSLYEGWGLPVAEALGFGKSVICSDRGAVPEVGGDLVEYVDPWDLPGWVRAIEGLWLDEARRQRMAERVVREYQTADWSATAGEIGRVAQELERGFVGTGPSPGGDISV